MPEELKYYYLPSQLEKFDASYDALQRRMESSIAECCEVPGAINIPVGVYGVNAPGDTIGKLGEMCLESKGIRGVDAWALSAICQKRDQMRPSTQLGRRSVNIA